MSFEDIIKTKKKKDKHLKLVNVSNGKVIGDYEPNITYTFYG